MRPQRIPPELAAVYRMDRAAQAMPWDGEATEPSGGDPGPDLVVRPDDIDYNGHLNNIRYVEWALRALPAEGRELRRLRVTYRGETRLGATVRVVTDGHRQAIVDGDRVAALVTTEWRDGSTDRRPAPSGR
jgi:medium-chain acyl-[acyl-carrier-protein] hydrolase